MAAPAVAAAGQSQLSCSAISGCFTGNSLITSEGVAQMGTQPKGLTLCLVLQQGPAVL